MLEIINRQRHCNVFYFVYFCFFVVCCCCCCRFFQLCDQNVCVRNRLYMLLISIDNLSNKKNETKQNKNKITRKKTTNKLIIKTKWHSVSFANTILCNQGIANGQTYMIKDMKREKKKNTHFIAEEKNQKHVTRKK